MRIVLTHGENERALMEDASATAAEMLEAAGTKEPEDVADSDCGLAIMNAAIAKVPVG